MQLRRGNLLYSSRILKCFAMQACSSGMFFMQLLILIFKNTGIGSVESVIQRVGARLIRRPQP